MKVILLRDISGLGRAGELKTVSDGYGRNYLLPKGLAALATPEEIRKWEARQKDLELQREKQRKVALETKEKIESLEMQKTLASGESGEIFGSLRKEDIIEFLNTRGINIPKDAIKLEQPIKKDGKYTVQISLANDVAATLKINLELSQQQ